MSPQARMAAGNAPLPEAGVQAGAEDAGAGPFVINLTSSTTPMALSHPDTPELKRFTFFVSRRREDNRERFRLHMGYFATLAEAEEWLNVIRDLYPGAWAGEAPGKKLRARAAAAELARQLPPPPPMARAMAATPPAQSEPPAAKEAPVAPVRAVTPASAPIVVPTLQAAPPVGPAPQSAVAASAAPMLEAVAQAAAALAAAAKTAVAQTSVTTSISFEAPPPAGVTPPRAQATPAAPTAAAPGAASSVARAAPAAPVTAPAQPAAPAPKAAAPAAPAAAPAPSKPSRKANPLVGGSNVREVMAALDGSEAGETRQMPIPPAVRAPAAAAAKPSAAPAARSASAPARAAAPAKPAAAAPSPAARGGDAMSDTQVLRMLETRRSGEGDRESDDANSGISLLKPDDTQTRRALKEAVLDNAPVSFAVQLQWSVQPVDLASVPPLAIFSAYTLYTVEGSREGRKWYGLRLGFFSDAISAKQVAYYVRSEFASVAVVPVSPAEKARATEAEAKASTTGAFQRKPPVEQKVDEFKLFDDDKPPVPEPPRVTAPPPEKSTRGTPRKKPLGRVRAKEQRSPKTLEETLEILGASDLEIDNGRGELLNDTGVRHLRVEVQKNTPFAKLLDRLSERVRRN